MTKKIGQQMADGTIFAGTTAGGKQIYAMPVNLTLAQTFNSAVQETKKLNSFKAFGHDDWKIPSEKDMIALCAGLKDIRDTDNRLDGSGDLPHWYGTSTKDHNKIRAENTDRVSIRAGNGEAAALNKNNRVSYRLVRLV